MFLYTHRHSLEVCPWSPSCPHGDHIKMPHPESLLMLTARQGTTILRRALPIPGIHCPWKHNKHRRSHSSPAQLSLWFRRRKNKLCALWPCNFPLPGVSPESFFAANLDPFCLVNKRAQSCFLLLPSHSYMHGCVLAATAGEMGSC